MFDIGFWELTLIGVIALLVIGPERLPGVARNVGFYVGRFRRYVGAVRADIEREINAEEIRKLGRESNAIGGLRDVVDETNKAISDARASLTEPAAPDPTPPPAPSAGAPGTGGDAPAIPAPDTATGPGEGHAAPPAGGTGASSPGAAAAPAAPHAPGPAQDSPGAEPAGEDAERDERRTAGS